MPADLLQMDPAAAKAFGAAIASGLKEGGYAPPPQPDAMRMGWKHTLPAGVPATNRFAHGPTGLFTLPGIEPDLYSTIIGTMGISELMSSTPSVDTNPLFTTVTGVQDESGDEPDDVCDDAPIAGLVKACTLTSVFGRLSRMTPEIDIGRFGQRVNRGDPMDLTVLNSPLMQGQAGWLTPSRTAGATLTGAVTSEMAKVLYEFAVNTQRQIAPEIWTGNPANNNAGQGRKFMTGFDLLISTGKVDAETATLCPSMDSDVKDFNYGCISDGGVPGDNLVNAITYMNRFLRSNARRMGLDPVNWVIAMREELFYEITAQWPCSYLTYRCDFRTDDGTIVQNVSATEQVQFRDAMRAGRFLTIDGVDVRVVFDDGIVEESSADAAQLLAGQFASNVYFIPLSVLGGRSSTFFEYFDFSNADINAARMNLAPEGSYDVTNGGAWLWHFKPPRNRCIQAQAWVEPRLIMRTPFLAGVLQNICYEPLQHTRQPFPDDNYFVDGGTTSRPAPSFADEWEF